MTPEHERLQSHLQRLPLHRMAEILDTVAPDAKEQLSYPRAPHPPAES